jgi:hypothetical protein
MEIPRVLRASPSAKYRTLREEYTRGRNSSPSVALGEEMHSGKRVFPECLIVHGTWGREALGENPLPRVQHSGKRGTNEQKMMWENGDIFKTLFPSAFL